MNYTKGEWKVADKRTLQGSFMILPKGSGGPIARVYLEANAYFIASAPDLYEACKGVLDWWRRNYDSFLPNELANVLKAVDKAEGK